MSEVSLGTLYELNKQAMAKEPVLTFDELFEKESLLENWLWNNGSCYYMLLCHEKRDYTLFNLKAGLYYEDLEYDVVRDLLDCLKNRGEIQSIEITEDNNAIEFWVKIDDESFCYYFFSYDKGVLEYGEQE